MDERVTLCPLSPDQCGEDLTKKNHNHISKAELSGSQNEVRQEGKNLPTVTFRTGRYCSFSLCSRWGTCLIRIWQRCQWLWLWGTTSRQLACLPLLPKCRCSQTNHSPYRTPFLVMTHYWICVKHTGLGMKFWQWLQFNEYVIVTDWEIQDSHQVAPHDESKIVSSLFPTLVDHVHVQNEWSGFSGFRVTNCNLPLNNKMPPCTSSFNTECDEIW